MLSGVSSTFINLFNRLEITDINDDLFVQINLMIKNDTMNILKEIFEDSIEELKHKYSYRTSYDSD